MTKRRVMKKHYRIVREALASGKPVPAFALFRVREYWDNYLGNRYLAVFRPWWYDNFDNWGQIDFKAAHHKHFNETMQLFTQETGIDLKKLGEELDKHNRPERTRKPRKEPPPDPIRKLRKPETFTIMVRQNGKFVPEQVEGEIAFRIDGYSFFIRHNGRQWVVSDVELGAALSFDYRYKAAIRAARERVEGKMDHYLDLVAEEKARRERDNP